MKTFEKSEKLFQEAQKHMVGGVNSPVRAFKSVGGTPVFIEKAVGSHLWDADGNQYIDYVGSWGPAIVGHAHPEVTEAVTEQLQNGYSFGASHSKEIELATAVKKNYPSIELIRFVCSGTEATMGAIRAARGYTGKNKIIKFDGCYHGHADYLLVKAGSGAQTLGIPDSAGIPPSFAELTLTAEYNNLESLKKIIQENKNEIACLILEPVIGNMGLIPPDENFLQEVRTICSNEKIVLIFDEVMTGFRVSLGGAQAYYKITPDLTCLGKVIGGGFPVGAYGGKKEIMQCVAPLGSVYQAGTLSGNPVAVTAGLKTLEIINRSGFYEDLEKKCKRLEEGYKSLALTKKIPFIFNRVGAMFSFFFSDKKIRTADDARQANKDKFNSVFHSMLKAGVYLPPSAFEAHFISSAHSDADIAKTLKAFDSAL